MFVRLKSYAVFQLLWTNEEILYTNQYTFQWYRDIYDNVVVLI